MNSHDKIIVDLFVKKNNLLNTHRIHKVNVDKKYDNGNHPLYKRAIEGWTIFDVKKREYAKKNNLNFKEVWNLEEGKEFIDNLAEKYAKMSFK